MCWLDFGIKRSKVKVTAGNDTWREFHQILVTDAFGFVVLISYWGQWSKVKVTAGNNPARKHGECNIFVNIWANFTKIGSYAVPGISANGRPSFEGYIRRCRPPDSNPENWVATSLGMWQYHVHDVISLTSTLGYQAMNVQDAQCSKFTSMISIHLQSCIPKIMKIHANL